jgi:long-chain acyl-CoA synthetase
MVTNLCDSPWQARQDRQTHRDAKREAVLLASARLFTEGGYQGTSLDDIARSLSVSKPTLYHYVENKDEILFACLQRGLSCLLGSIADSGVAAGREELRATLQRYADHATADFGLCVIRVGDDPLPEVRRQELRDSKLQIEAEFRGLVERGMAQGWIEPGDVATTAHAVVDALNGIGRWCRPGEHGAQSLSDAKSHCIEMLMRGVLVAPGTRGGAGMAPTASTVPPPALRIEAHFGDRVTRCFVERPSSLAQMLADAVAHRPDAEALVSDSLRLSWRELHHAARKCAGGLALRNVRNGDRVALHLSNGPEFVIVTLACAWLGAVLVPVSARAHAGELRFALEDSGAVAIVCTPESLALLPARDALPDLKHRFIVTGAVDSPNEPMLALMQAEPLAEAHAAQEEDLAVLLYTSGTTGNPKGAMLTHFNIAHSVLHYVHRMGLTEEDRSIIAVPLCHVTGLIAQLYVMLYVRGCAVLMAQFKASEFVRLAARERITHSVLVPAMYNLCLLLDDLNVHDLSHWRIGAYGGAAMPTASITALAERLPGMVLMNAYGATETTSPATIMPQGQTAAHRDSVGQTVDCGDIRIMDESGRELPGGEVGEIWIAGPMVMPGYWRDAEATRREFCGGYWRSGDIGSIDAQGYLRVLDRKKDVINRGGYKIFCVQMESALAEHAQVIESALVGVPCPVLGERVHAFVCVRAMDVSTTASALTAFCASRMADYAVPETWSVGTDPLPRNLNGKIMKRALRQSLQEVAA